MGVAGVLDGIKVVEVSMWAMVPACGVILGEWGADVIKVEGPDGDPVRSLVTAGLKPVGPRFTWEMWNRGKRDIALDLTTQEAQGIVHQLVAEADVFLTSILPSQRAKLGIDLDTIRGINPSIVYAVGLGQGSQGPEANKGGYDGITFWARSGAAASVTPPGGDPVGLPAGAFGDATSGMALAGGVAAALVRRARTGEGSVVEASLLATAMWAMQMSITGSAAAGIVEMPRMTRRAPFNVLVNTYQTSDGRWISLSMLQADAYWAGFCQAIDRVDLIEDPRFADATARAENHSACIDELDKTFGAHPLQYWAEHLATQEGQWDVLKRVSEVLEDRQVVANHFAHRVEYGDGHELHIVGSPVQFDQTPPTLRPAPSFAGDTDEILGALGWDMDAILEAKIKGAVI